MNAPRPLSIALGLTLALAPLTSFAGLIEEADTEVGTDTEDRHFVLVGKLVGGMTSNREETVGLVGPGFDVEMELWSHGMELELAGAALFGQEMTCFPTELLLKQPLHLTDELDLFAGVGAIVNFVHAHEAWAAHPGGLGIVGGTLWDQDHRFGMVLEVTYAMLDEHGHLAHEVEAAVGVAYRL